MPWLTFRPRRDPFRELEQFRRQMDRLWEESFGAEPRLRWPAGVYPLVNISEDKDHLFVRAELPGVNPADLEITLENNNLTLRGERKMPQVEKESDYHRREREAGSFRRVIRLPERVDPAKVEATCQDGVLTITLTKPEEIKPKQIKVKTA